MVSVGSDPNVSSKSNLASSTEDFKASGFLAKLRALADEYKGLLELPENIFQASMATVGETLDPILDKALEERPLTGPEKVLDQLLFNTRNESVKLDESGSPILKPEPGFKDLFTPEGRKLWKDVINE